LEGKQALLQVIERAEVVGREDLALNDGEVDLDLVEPTGMDRNVDEYGAWGETAASPNGVELEPATLAPQGTRG